MADGGARVNDGFLLLITIVGSRGRAPGDADELNRPGAKAAETGDLNRQGAKAAKDEIDSLGVLCVLAVRRSYGSSR